MDMKQQKKPFRVERLSNSLVILLQISVYDSPFHHDTGNNNSYSNKFGKIYTSVYDLLQFNDFVFFFNGKMKFLFKNSFKF